MGYPPTVNYVSFTILHPVSPADWVIATPETLSTVGGKRHRMKEILKTCFKLGRLERTTEEVRTQALLCRCGYAGMHVDTLQERCERMQARLGQTSPQGNGLG